MPLIFFIDQKKEKAKLNVEFHPLALGKREAEHEHLFVGISGLADNLGNDSSTISCMGDAAGCSPDEVGKL